MIHIRFVENAISFTVCILSYVCYRYEKHFRRTEIPMMRRWHSARENWNVRRRSDTELLYSLLDGSYFNNFVLYLFSHWACVLVCAGWHWYFLITWVGTNLSWMTGFIARNHKINDTLIPLLKFSVCCICHSLYTKTGMVCERLQKWGFSKV